MHRWQQKASHMNWKLHVICTHVLHMIRTCSAQDTRMHHKRPTHMHAAPRVPGEHRVLGRQHQRARAGQLGLARLARSVSAAPALLQQHEYLALLFSLPLRGRSGPQNQQVWHMQVKR